MSFREFLLLVFYELRPMLPGVIALVLCTLGALVYLNIRARSAWVDSESFDLSSLFFSMGAREVTALSCAWIKLILALVYVLSFKKLVLIQLLVLIFPGLIFACLTDGMKKAGSALFYLALELAGLICASLIAGYITEMQAGLGFVLVYVAIGFFMLLFAAYLFLQDLEFISKSRRINVEETWERGRK